MSRKIPDCPQRPSDARPWKDYEDQTYSLQLVTPMFGGGVEAGKPDPVTLIRRSAIRGHLRFWWRATCGADSTSARDLKQRKTEIFGDTEHTSPVTNCTGRQQGRLRFMICDWEQLSSLPMPLVSARAKSTMSLRQLSRRAPHDDR